MVSSSHGAGRCQMSPYMWCTYVDCDACVVQAGMIPIQMELGGKDACIVCEDADIELAAKNIVKV